MIKFSNWGYFKVFVIFAVISSIMFMKKYSNFGSKGEYNLNEYTAVGDTGVYKVAYDCNKDCASDKLKNKIDVIKCLDSCAANNINNVTPVPNKNIPADNIVPVVSSYNFWVILSFVLFSGLIVNYFKKDIRNINNRLKQILSKPKEKSIYDDEEEEVLGNEYKKLVDI